jgi:hypothetical protein
MTWLEERELVAEFKCPESGDTVRVTYRAGDGLPEAPKSDRKLVYVGTLPYHMGGATKVEYEQNGRKAFCINDGNGNIQYRSKSKEHYLNTGEIPKDIKTSENSRAETDFMNRMVHNEN